MSELLFSYGTLQLEKVQMESFGRLLHGQSDRMTGFTLSQVEITDPDVLAKSGQQFHPVAVPSGSGEDSVAGVVFEITASELAQADAYEVGDYARVEVRLASGRHAWVYVLKEYAAKATE